MPEPTDAQLRAALADALDKAQSAHDALQAVSRHLVGVRGGYWVEGAVEVSRAEAAARHALSHARGAGALLRHSLETEPVELQRML